MLHLYDETVAWAPEYEMTWEIWDEGTVCHFVFHPGCFSKSVYQRALTHWDLLRSVRREPLICIGPADEDAKWRKFVERMGFTFRGHVPLENGESRSLYYHITRAH